MYETKDYLSEDCRIHPETWELLRDFAFGTRTRLAWLVEGGDPDKSFFATATLNARNQREFQIHFPEGGREGIQNLTFALDMNGRIRSYHSNLSGITALIVSDEPSYRDKVTQEEISTRSEIANSNVPALLIKIMDRGIQFPSVAWNLERPLSR